jgi:hypothetical protein
MSFYETLGKFPSFHKKAQPRCPLWVKSRHLRRKKSDVRFTPKSDRKSGFPHKVMSVLPPKADMCSALAYVCFGPKADISTSNAMSPTAKPSFAAVKSDTHANCFG